MATATLTESIGRSALLAASVNYRSVADALMELIDNPIDKRKGRKIVIDVGIDKKKDGVTILDVGGEGMDDAGLQEWILWGEGVSHSSGDIGQYHIGGKLAAIYLAESLEIRCRKAGDNQIWRFVDAHWGSRTETLRDEPIQRMAASSISWPRSIQPSDKDGFTQVTLKELKEHRYEIDRLINILADTYRSLIQEGKCVIRVNGTVIEPIAVPWATSVDPVVIPPTRLGRNVVVSGKIGAIDRERLPSRYNLMPMGIRTEFNGRKITDSEEFRHNLRGRNPLGRLYGEIKIAVFGNGFKPNQLKNGWPTDSPEWTAVEEFVHEQMRPVINQLNSITSARRVTREERKWASRAAERIGNAIKRLHLRTDAPSHQNPPNGRKPPEPELNPRPHSARQEPEAPPSKRNPRTPAPRNAVGVLRRLANVLPRVDYDELGPGSPRTELRADDNDHSTIVINRDYPLALNRLDEEYVFESLVDRFAFDEASTLFEYREIYDQLIWNDRMVREE